MLPTGKELLFLYLAQSVVPLYRLASSYGAYDEVQDQVQGEVGMMMLPALAFPRMLKKEVTNCIFLALSVSLLQLVSISAHSLTSLSLHQPPHGTQFLQNSLQGALTVTHTAGGLCLSRRDYICWKVNGMLVNETCIHIKVLRL